MEKQLQKNTPKNLSNSRFAERQKNIKRLHDYWVKEKFPKNTKYPGQMLPHIKDDFGTPCAMAYIIEKSGNPNLVRQLQTTNNLVYIEDVKEGPLMKWIDKSGLTKSETEQIQPTYCGETCRFFLDNGFWAYPLIFSVISIGLGSLGIKILQKKKFSYSKKIIAYFLAGVIAFIIGLYITSSLHYSLTPFQLR